MHTLIEQLELHARESYGIFRLCSKDKRSILARKKDALTSVGANFFEKIHKKVFQCQIFGTENLK